MTHPVIDSSTVHFASLLHIIKRKMSTKSRLSGHCDRGKRERFNGLTLFSCHQDIVALEIFRIILLFMIHPEID